MCIPSTLAASSGESSADSPPVPVAPARAGSAWLARGLRLARQRARSQRGPPGRVVEAVIGGEAIEGGHPGLAEYREEVNRQNARRAVAARDPGRPVEGSGRPQRVSGLDPGFGRVEVEAQPERDQIDVSGPIRATPKRETASRNPISRSSGSISLRPCARARSIAWVVASITRSGLKR